MSCAWLVQLFFILGVAVCGLEVHSAGEATHPARSGPVDVRFSDVFIADVVSTSRRPQERAPTRELPSRLVVAYPNWGACGSQVEQAVQNGVNVVAWSFGVLSSTHNPVRSADITVQPDLTCVRNVVERTTQLGRPVIHLLSFGGWGTQHPEDTFSGEAYYESWIRLVWGHPRSDGSPLFDGLDWDFEGADDKSARTNTFSVETLDIMGTMSTLAKRDGFLVSMAPAQSYLDYGSANFSRSLLFEDAEWEAEFAAEQGEGYRRPFFGYHGRNCYAYLLAACGGWHTFDFVSLQLYESFSRFGYSVQVRTTPTCRQ